LFYVIVKIISTLPIFNTLPVAPIYMTSMPLLPEILLLCNHKYTEY